ncbi:MAG: hypothetical protein JSW73_03415 [Candidatus Woesearchaeota archaeon]|nr:MAG: hypothetical protein JSW73_03415 [Candidatus Woesearchaeota archaeon]
MLREKKTLERVLLLAEHPEIHKKLISFLTDEKSVEILEATNYDDAIWLLTDIKRKPKNYTNSKPDVVLLDFSFPNFDHIRKKIDDVGIPYTTLKSVPYLKIDYTPKAEIQLLKAKYYNLS